MSPVTPVSSPSNTTEAVCEDPQMAESVRGAAEFYGGLSSQLDDLTRDLREMDARIANLSLTAHTAYVDLVSELDPDFLLTVLQATIDCRECIEKMERAKAQDTE